MSIDKDKQIKIVLASRFDQKRGDQFLKYFTEASEKLRMSDWEGCLIKSGKFVESVVKAIWIHGGKTLPREKDFKASLYSQKIIDEISTTNIPEDVLRLLIPRACIFIYNITSNRGGRHDSEHLDPNEMDATTIIPVCSWILAEMIRISSVKISVNDAKNIVNGLIERQYPSFEDIDGRIYVDNEKFKSAIECELLILYKSYPKRVTKDNLSDFLKRHSFKPTSFKFERLNSYVDINEQGFLLRATGRRKAEKILIAHKK